MIFNKSKEVKVPPKSYITSEQGDDGRLYAKSGSKLYRLSRANFESASEVMAEAFLVIAHQRYICISPKINEGSDSYYIEGKEIWNVPEEKGILIYRGNTLVTAPDIKLSVLDIRDMNTFKIINTIRANENFEFIRNFHYILNDKIIFIQREKNAEITYKKLLLLAVIFKPGWFYGRPRMRALMLLN